MTEVQEGVCSAHQGANTLSKKVILQGYYWPSIVEDCIKNVKACPVCQPFAKKETRPATYYMPVCSAIPFARWGIDILGPLPMAVGRVKFCIVVVDYFTKWTEAAPLATITEQQCPQFLWKQILCQFGLPKHLITDNAQQFEARPWVEFCRMYAIQHTTSSVAYP